ncbi:hypothetical protein NDU88_008398 [Pleurodeles waltl]|uniref:Uncharacterized protein n=1 Tax=Pleurodeles waltl TaxID=8319 RepID=A0AAV7NXP9_PLEWA|nr:hypothetical protein NDU88_008398 [Pleurodeles waltl]
MAWAYFCWRDGGGLVTSTFPPTAGLAGCCGCRIFGGLAAAGQNDRGGLPRPRRNYGGFLTGGRRLLPPRNGTLVSALHRYIGYPALLTFGSTHAKVLRMAKV